MTHTDNTNTVCGQCHCGRIQFAATLPAKWCAHCHCSICRQVQGAGFITWVGFAKTSVTLLQGKKELHWYQSSNSARRGFCRHCGGHLFFEGEQWVDETHVTRASLRGDPHIQPQAHAYFDSHVDWVPLDEQLPRIKHTS